MEMNSAFECGLRELEVKMAQDQTELDRFKSTNASLLAQLEALNQSVNETRVAHETQLKELNTFYDTRIRELELKLGIKKIHRSFLIKID